MVGGQTRSVPQFLRVSSGFRRQRGDLAGTAIHTAFAHQTLGLHGKRKDLVGDVLDGCPHCLYTTGLAACVDRFQRQGDALRGRVRGGAFW